MIDFPKSWPHRLSLAGLALLFVAAGVNHFLNPAMYLRIMPPYLPAPLTLVYLSGVLEIIGGLAVLPRRTRAAAGWFLVLLLVAVFPANVHMAIHPEEFAPIPAWSLYARLPLQLVLIWWAYAATRPKAERGL